MEGKEKFIVCSAIWYKDLPAMHYLPRNVNRGVVLCGLRHPNIIHQLFALTKLRTVRHAPDAAGRHVQGFLTNNNLFVSRNRAAKIAYAAGQVSEKKETLYSEDLW